MRDKNGGVFWFKKREREREEYLVWRSVCCGGCRGRWRRFSSREGGRRRRGRGERESPWICGTKPWRWKMPLRAERERVCFLCVWERERQRELNFPRRRSDFRVLCLWSCVRNKDLKYSYMDGRYWHSSEKKRTTNIFFFFFFF